jgi:hypothetical protein
MNTNDPCKACFWLESRRCWNGNLGLGKPPRGAPLFSGENGFVLTDQHLEICADVGGRNTRSTFDRLNALFAPKEG